MLIQSVWVHSAVGEASLIWSLTLQKLAFVTNGIALRMLESGASDAERTGKATSFDQVTVRFEP